MKNTFENTQAASTEIKRLREKLSAMEELSKLQGAMLSEILAEKKKVTVKRTGLKKKLGGNMKIKKTKNSYILEFEG